jgi:hypothetical protein
MHKLFLNSWRLDIAGVCDTKIRISLFAIFLKLYEMALLL